MSTRAKHLQAAGAVLDGYARDAGEIEQLGFPVFSRGLYAQDQGARGKVIDWRCEIQIEQVFECLACNLADCALSNIGEDRVQHFAKERSTNTSSAVCVGVTTV